MNLAWMNRALTASLFALAMGLGAGCANGNAETCDPACPSSFYQCCGGALGPTCRDVVNDPNNCGGCGVTCPSGVCTDARCATGPAPVDAGMGGGDSGSGGSCSPTCSSDQRCCGATCFSRSVAVGTNGRSDSSFNACNGCGIACDMERASACSVPSGGAGMPRCMCGTQDQCATGQICVPQAGSFTCVSTGNDPNNCGGVGTRCAMGESCIGGNCQCGSTGTACFGGQACCATGCVDLMNDSNNCGGCGVVCGGGTACDGGRCLCHGQVCAAPSAGTFGLGATCGEVCCDSGCVPADEANCGACGTTCPTGQICGMMVDFLGGGAAMPPACVPPEGGGGIFPIPPTECDGEAGGGFPLPFP